MTDYTTSEGGILIPKPRQPSEAECMVEASNLAWQAQFGFAPCGPSVAHRWELSECIDWARWAYYEGRRVTRMERGCRDISQDDRVLSEFAEEVHPEAYQRGRTWASNNPLQLDRVSSVGYTVP